MFAQLDGLMDLFFCTWAFRRVPRGFSFGFPCNEPQRISLFLKSLSEFFRSLAEISDLSWSQPRKKQNGASGSWKMMEITWKITWKQYGFVWTCWVNIPNEIAIFHRDNDQQNHWVDWGTNHFQTYPYGTSMELPSTAWHFVGGKGWTFHHRWLVWSWSVPVATCHQWLFDITIQGSMETCSDQCELSELTTEPYVCSLP